jgi:hypothetical protein
VWDVAFEVPRENIVFKSSLFYSKVFGGRVERYNSVLSIMEVEGNTVQTVTVAMQYVVKEGKFT